MRTRFKILREKTPDFACFVIAGRSYFKVTGAEIADNIQRKSETYKIQVLSAITAEFFL